MRNLGVILLSLALLALCSTSFGLWAYYKEYNMPANMEVPIMMAGDDSRDILYVSGYGNFPDPDLVLRITDLLTDVPSSTVIHSRVTETYRGFTGLALDEANNILYVSGDSGSANKFVDRINNPHATPSVETDWLAPTDRIHSCEMAYDGGAPYLLVDVYTLALIRCYRVSDKADMGNATLSTTYGRDLAFDPATNDIYCNRNSNLQRITGGSPTNMAGYGTGVDVIDNGVSVNVNACCIELNDLVTPKEIIYNSRITENNDVVYICYLDDENFQNDKMLPILDSPVMNYWEFATDSQVMEIGGELYLFVGDAAGVGIPARIVVFKHYVPQGAKAWQLYP